MAKNKSRENELSGLAFVGFLILGLAFGAFFNRYDVGALAGLGLGFIAIMTVRAQKYNA